MPPQKIPSQIIDLTRLNRAQRRKKGSRIGGMMLPGRNMPFQKKLHGTIQQFNETRAKEIAEEQKQRAEEQAANTAAISSAALKAKNHSKEEAT